MNWNDIPLFLAISEQRSLAGAARVLGVNHSTAFRRLNALEGDMGMRLFERLPQGYLLTAAGEELVDYAYQAQAAVDTLSRRAAGRDQTLAGDVRFTTAPNLANRYVPWALERLRERHPGIRVEVIVSDSDYDLARREADLALRATRRPPDYLVGRKVVDLTWYVIGSPRYLEGRDVPRCMEHLTGHALIGADASFQRLEVFRHLHRRFPREQFVATANTLDSMAALAKRGLGLAVLPSDQLTAELGALFPFEPRVPGALWLLTHPDLRRVARIRALSDALVAELSADSRLADRAGADL
jgi:DNA-binding transcriptional LysR family regulator